MWMWARLMLTFLVLGSPEKSFATTLQHLPLVWAPEIPDFVEYQKNSLPLWCLSGTCRLSVAMSWVPEAKNSYVLAREDEFYPQTDTARMPGVQPTLAFRPKPTTGDVLFTSGLASPHALAMGAWRSADGTKIAFFVGASPASEAFSQTLVVKDARTDAKVWQMPILTLDESQALQPNDLERLVRGRLIEAEAKLPWKKWVPMEGGELPDPGFASDQCFLSRAAPERVVDFSGLKVTYQEPRFRVERGSTLLVDIHRPSWRSYDTNCNTFNPSWLQSLYLDASGSIMLVGLGYCGVDACPEPPQGFHVISIQAGVVPLRLKKGIEREEKAVRVGFESAENLSDSLYAQGVPAVSVDGTLTLEAWTEMDGGRGEQNLHLKARRVDGNAQVWVTTLLNADEVSSHQGSLEELQGLGLQVMKRVAAVNAELASRDWITMKALNPSPIVGAECVAPPQQTLSLPEADVSLERGILTVRRSKAGPPAVRTVLVPPRQAEDAPCRDISSVFWETAYVDLERKVLLLRLGTCASAECLTQAPRFHALRLP